VEDSLSNITNFYNMFSNQDFAKIHALGGSALRIKQTRVNNNITCIYKFPFSYPKWSILFPGRILKIQEILHELSELSQRGNFNAVIPMTGSRVRIEIYSPSGRLVRRKIIKLISLIWFNDYNLI